MRFGELLQQNKDAIVQRWFDAALATYSGDSVAAFRRQKDPFANPIGHSLRVGTLGLFEALLDGMNSEEIHRYLHDIIKIRAVQELSASQAVCFVFLLKEAIRAELGAAVREPQFLPELAKLEGRIDRIALAAFDVLVRCREQVCELRVNEVKRKVSWIVNKMNKRAVDPELDRISLG